MFKGSMVALVTPFKDGEVDWKKLDELVDFHIDAGTDALVPCGTMTQHARENGAEGSLLVVPYYNKPTQEGLFLHFSAIAKAVNFPHVLYNIPGRCSVEMSTDTIVRLRKTHEVAEDGSRGG